MDSILLTITQALQLVALAPCVFVIAFLLATMRQRANILPVLYFLSLSCSFVIPLLTIFGDMGEDLRLYGILLLGESLTTSLGFLLVMQFLLGRTPPPVYWLILSLPLLGGSPFIYASLIAEDVCFDATKCYSVHALRTLYNVFGVALVFLLLIYKISVARARIVADDTERRHKYWLIIALVALNLSLAAVDLLELNRNMLPGSGLLAATLIRIAFIYLVLTSIFRVFYELFDLELPQARPGGNAKIAEADKALVAQARALLEEEKIYREMGLTRAMLAEKLRISEQQASRIINAYFKKNFNEWINGYRVAEAKERLLTEDSAVTVIAFEVGFNSIASFNRVFKEMEGVSPTEYRAFHRNSVG